MFKSDHTVGFSYCYLDFSRLEHPLPRLASSLKASQNTYQPVTPKCTSIPRASPSICILVSQLPAERQTQPSIVYSHQLSISKGLLITRRSVLRVNFRNDYR